MQKKYKNKKVFKFKGFVNQNRQETHHLYFLVQCGKGLERRVPFEQNPSEEVARRPQIHHFHEKLITWEGNRLTPIEDPWHHRKPVSKNK